MAAKKKSSSRKRSKKPRSSGRSKSKASSKKRAAKRASSSRGKSKKSAARKPAKKSSPRKAVARKIGLPRAAAPPRRDQSVISRVVEQVRETPGSFGRPTSPVMPARREDEMDIGGGGEMESGPNDEF